MAKFVRKEISRTKRGTSDDTGASSGIERPSGQTYARPQSSPYDPESTSGTLDNIGKTLADNEAAASTPAAQDSKKNLSPTQVRDAESMGDGLYRSGDAKNFKKVKSTFFGRRRKAVAGFGIGAAGVTLITITTVLPNYQIPSLMDGLRAVAGEVVEEVVEHRAQRMIIAYLIAKAGGNLDDFVVTDSWLGTMFKTYQVNKVEEKIKRESGHEIVRFPDDSLHLMHRDKDLGAITGYDDVLKLLEGNPQAKKSFKKIARIISPSWRMLVGTHMSKAFRDRYGRYGVHTWDRSKTPQENLEALRGEQVDTVTRENTSSLGRALGCATGRECDAYDPDNDAYNPLDPANRAPDLSRPDGSAGELDDAGREAAGEARDAVVKTGASYTDTVKQALTKKLITAGVGGAATGGIITLISVVSLIQHALGDALRYNLVVQVPADIKASALGAMTHQWAGFGDQIKAGKMPLLYIMELNRQVAGAYKGQGYKCAFRGECDKGEPIEAKVNNNQYYPDMERMDSMYNGIFLIPRAPFEAWYYTEEAIGWVAAKALGFLIGHPIEEAMNRIFGEDWEAELSEWLMGFVIKFFAWDIDPMAVAAKMGNQLFTGWMLLMNSYAASIGMRAMTPMIPETNFYKNFGALDADVREDMAMLPVSERVFSLDEPSSLLSLGLRALPTSSSPRDWIEGTVGQVATLPAKLLGVFTGRSSAASPTLEQLSATAGVRGYGATAEDLNMGIAPELTAAGKPECPEVDQETTFNACKVDKVVMGALECQYENCPELSTGFGQPSTMDGLWANVKQSWNVKQVITAITW